MSQPPSPVELMSAYDAGRERTQQREIGMSAIGGCRRKAGYLLADADPTEEGGSVQAVIGTGMHSILAEQAMKDAGPGDLIEYEVRFAGLLGHVDYYHAETRTLVDWKSASKWKFETVQADGIGLDNRHQTALYAAALTVAGHPVDWIVLDYVHRDSGEHYRHRRRFVQTEVRAALDWTNNIRTAELDMLPRDYQPTSPFCRGCQFLTLCWTDRAVPGRDLLTALWTDEPDAVKWRDELNAARADERAAKDRAERARGALDALRPEGGGRVDVAGGKTLSWSESSSLVMDQEMVRGEYAAAGATPPMKRSSKVTLNLVKPKAASKAKREPEEQAEAS